MQQTIAPQTGVFVCSGEYWTLGYSGKTFTLKDTKGLGYIQRLLQHPGEEFHSLDLLNGPNVAAVSETSREDAASILSDATVSIGGLGDAGEMLDSKARQQYQRRLFELREELEDQRERGNEERAASIETEIDFITREIARAVGLGGHHRRAGSAAERARLNVTRAIKSALQRVSEHGDAFGELLDRSIRTGSFCSYVTDSRSPIAWRFSLEGQTPTVAAEATAPLLVRREVSLLPSLADRTTFVGRETERAALRRALERVLQGESKVVMIGGALGVGKTRIAGEIAAEATQKGFLTLVGSCYDRENPIPYSPFVEILEAALARSSSPEAFRQALGNDASEMARLMPQLRRQFPDLPQPLEISPEQSRRILFNAVAELLGRTAQSSPMLLLFEDLHWADEGTLSLLNHLARSVAKIPVMMVGTYRDNELEPAGELAQTLDELLRIHMLEQINLRGLPENAVAEMIRALSGREPPPSVVSIIYAGSDGNPFFVEELFRHLVERGKLMDSTGEFRRDLKPTEIDVPQSLRLVIGRRLARLSEQARKILGTAAVIGRSFTFELLEASTDVDADSLLDRVEEAERSGLISSTLEYPEARFQFSHELIRQAVLGDLSGPRRQRLHLNVAEGIERAHANTVEDHANDLAHHLFQAGAHADADKTVRYLSIAAKRALEQSAYEDASIDLRNSLELLRKLPDSQERAQRELDLQIDYAMARVALKGWHVPEVGDAYKRARELCQGLGATPRLFSVLHGLWSFHLVRGEHPMARVYSDEMLQLAPRMPDDGLLVQANWALGCSQFMMGELLGAHESFAQAIRKYDRQRHRTLAFLFEQDPCMSALSFDAMTLWTLGFSDQANQRANESLTLARSLGYPFTLTWCLAELAILNSLRGDFAGAARFIDEGLALSQEHGFAFYEEGFFAYHLLGLAAQGKTEELAAVGRQARKISETGYEIHQTWFRSAFAEALGNLGRFNRAFKLLAEAAEVMDRNDERYVESEIHRIRGDLTLKNVDAHPGTAAELQAAESTAEQNFINATEIARRRGAKALELRAALSLSRLQIRQGNPGTARNTLKASYDWFTEGFDTPELKAAKAMLDNLERTSARVSNP